jgi:hypothetical protein
MTDIANDKLNKEDLFKKKIYTKELRGIINDVEDLNEDAREFMQSVVDGVHKSAIIYGPPGLGKTHVITTTLNDNGLVEGEDYALLRSHTTPLMLYIMLYLFRENGKFVVLDDCDGIYLNETGLNLLKAAMDNTFGQVGWASSQDLSHPITKQPIPNKFAFEGTLIISTNIKLASGRSRIANHVDAIRSRATSCALDFVTKEEQFAQVFHMLVDNDYLATDEATTITKDEKMELLAFLYVHLEKIRRLDLRLPQTLAREIKNKKENWQRRALRIIKAA